MGFAVKADQAQSDRQAYERMKDKVMDEVKRFFRPEFLNRLDATIVFHALSKEEIHQIVDLMMNMVREELKEREISIELTEPARGYLAENGFDPVLGARPLRRLIQNEVEDRLSDELLGGKFEEGDTAIVDIDEDGKICIKVRKPEMAALPVA
jgi:ATP-dependent Clp protease ATP-binding subunit ClpC